MSLINLKSETCNYQLIAADLGDTYLIGVGLDIDDGHAMQLTVDQARQLAESLVEFVKENEQ